MKNILAFDGGGLKGFYELIIIDALQKKFDLLKEVDLFIGTSIGAVIASALAKQIIPRQILTHFQNKINSKLSHHELLLALEDWINDIFKDRYFGEISNNIFLPVYDSTNNQRAYFGAGSPINADQVPIVEILSAVCADMRLVPSYYIPSLETSFYDAGVFAYDPVIFFMETKNVTKSENINILSIGSGVIENISQDLNTNEKLDLMYDIMLKEQFTNTSYFFRQLASDFINYYRFSEFPLTHNNNITLNDILQMATIRTNNLNINPFDPKTS